MDVPDTTTYETTEWMTYAELAANRGISKRSAMRLALRHRWPRRRGNDGMARVGVPTGADKSPERQSERPATTADSPTVRAIAALETAVVALRSELERAHAETAEARQQVEALRQARKLSGQGRAAGRGSGRRGGGVRGCSTQRGRVPAERHPP
jgi:hypothetical protein